MDDDRQARAQAGDLDAFLEGVRPRAGRLVRLAAIAAGEPAVAHRAARTAIRAARRDAPRLVEAGDLDRALERGLADALPRRRRTPSTEPIDRALAPLAPAERVALARCLDPLPDPAALAVAGRAGVEVAGGEGGDIVDLDGPLAGWDLPRLRAALGTAAAAVREPEPALGDPGLLVDEAAGELAGTRPDTPLQARVRDLVPRGRGLAGAATLVLAAALGTSLLAWSTGERNTAADAAQSADRPATGPGGGAPVVAAPAGEPGGVATRRADALAGFPAEVAGLAVVGIREATALARVDSLAGASIAIRGWLARPELAGACDPPGDGEGGPGETGTGRDFCLRQATLRERPEPGFDVPHLHPQLLPGVGLGSVARDFTESRELYLPVVVIAHFDDPLAAPCTPGGRHCGEELVIDSVAWAAGTVREPPVAVAPRRPWVRATRSPAEARRIVEEAFGDVRALSVAGVPATDLATLEPGAAAYRPTDRLAWLVRVLVTPNGAADASATRTWVVVGDETGRVTPAQSVDHHPADEPGATLFPRLLDGTLVHGHADAIALARGGLPAGSTLAIAGWLATPALVGSCLDEGRGAAWPLEPAAAFCDRAVILRGPTGNGRAMFLRLPPGTPSLPIDGAVAARRMPVPVVALVQVASPRAEPCWPSAAWCGRELVLERLLWVDGTMTEVPVAALDAADAGRPRLTPDDVGALAAASLADGGRVVSIVRVPAAARGRIAPGTDGHAVTGAYAWIVRVRDPLPWKGDDWPRFHRLGWLLVDDATGQVSTGARPDGQVPGAAVTVARLAPA